MGSVDQHNSRRANVRWALLLAIVVTMGPAGCAAFRRQGPVPEAVAASRELSRQGVSSMQLGQWDEAERLLRDALEATPTDPVTRRHLAEALWRRGAVQEALVQIEAAARLDPADVPTMVRAGEMLLSTGKTRGALQRAEQAIGLDAEYAPAWALRGRVFWQMNQLDRALADLQRALQFAPASNDVLTDVATLYRQRGQHQRCLTTVEHLLDNYGSGEEPQYALFLHGVTLAELGRHPDAIGSLTRASQGQPNAEILYQLAQCQGAIGQVDAAVATANQALAVDATHQPSRQLIAQLAARPVAEPALR